MILLAATLVLLCQDAQISADPADTGPGPDTRSVPLTRVFPFWEDYLALPDDERNAFEIVYQFNIRGPEQVQFWVETADGPLLLSLGPDNVVIPPVNAAFDRGGDLLTDAPQGGVSVSMQLHLSGEPSDQYQVSQIEAALAQAHNAVRSAMGVRALFMPRLDTVRFEFDGPAPEAFVILDDGRREALTSVYENIITVTPRDRDLRNATLIEFGDVPLRAILEPSD